MLIHLFPVLEKLGKQFLIDRTKDQSSLKSKTEMLSILVKTKNTINSLKITLAMLKQRNCKQMSKRHR